MNPQLPLKMSQFPIANPTGRVTKAGPMSEAIALGLRCDSHLDLTHR